MRKWCTLLLSAIISANIVFSWSNIFLLFCKQSTSSKMGYPKDFCKWKEKPCTLSVTSFWKLILTSKNFSWHLIRQRCKESLIWQGLNQHDSFKDLESMFQLVIYYIAKSAIMDWCNV